MLPRVNSNLNLPPSQQSKTRKHYEKYEFVSTYLAGVTNKDQYDRMVDFEKNVLYRLVIVQENNIPVKTNKNWVWYLKVLSVFIKLNGCFSLKYLIIYSSVYYHARNGIGNSKDVGSEGLKHLEEKIIVGMFNLNKSKSTKYTALKKINVCIFLGIKTCTKSLKDENYRFLKTSLFHDNLK